jgi:hypothetical protein
MIASLHRAFFRRLAARSWITGECHAFENLQSRRNLKRACICALHRKIAGGNV